MELNSQLFFTWRSRDLPRIWPRNDFKDFDVENVAAVVAIDEHVAPVRDGESVQDVLQRVKGDAAAVVTSLGLLDPGMEGELGLPDGRRAGEGSGLEPDVEIGLEERHLGKIRLPLVSWLQSENY